MKVTCIIKFHYNTWKIMHDVIRLNHYGYTVMYREQIILSTSSTSFKKSLGVGRKSLFMHMYSRPKKKGNTTINSNTNYRREIKLVPINMGYCLLKFDALKFILGVRLHGGGL